MIEQKRQLFPTSLMGSLPRSKKMMKALSKKRLGNFQPSEFTHLLEEEFLEVIRFQEKLGVDVITSGELSRDNYCSFVADKLGGVRLMSLSEMLDYIEDKKAFDTMLSTLDTPASSVRNAICAGQLEYKEGLALDELLFMKKHTKKPVKITLPGPYLLTRSMWLADVSGNAYESKEALGEAVVRILKKEIDALQNAGAEVIQFDEPVLTEVVFMEGKPRSFMCGALAEKKDPKEELAFASSLIKPVLSYADRTKTVSSLHVCRGNWSRDESTLLSGSYEPLKNVFEEAGADMLTLEFSTPRAGELSSLFSSEKIRKNMMLGLGVINPRTGEIESAEQIVKRAEECMEWIPKERIWLNPDCGFATFANQPLNEYDIIREKIAVLTEAAHILRERYE